MRRRRWSAQLYWKSLVCCCDWYPGAKCNEASPLFFDECHEVNGLKNKGGNLAHTAARVFPGNCLLCISDFLRYSGGAAARAPEGLHPRGAAAAAASLD